jgi:benzylsuccinate CoA-transferase BbsF subunit
MGVLVVLSALDYRRRTGKGQFIDIAQIEVTANLIGEAYLDYTVNGRVQKPAGNRNPHAAPHGCYPCKGDDQWCAISVFSDDEWQNFCSAIGNPAWSSDPKFANTQGRLENVDELDKLIAEWTINREPAEVMNTLQAGGVAAGLVQRGVDWANDPQLQHLNAMIEVDHPIVGKLLYPNAPFKISDMVFPSSTPAPLFGQHTEEICQEMLNMSQDEIERLKKEEVLEVQVD